MEAVDTIIIGSIQHIHPTYAENLPTLARMFNRKQP